MGTPQSGTAGVANQVADAVRQAAGYRSVEVALHPEELGRVRLSFSPAEAGLTVTIQADRPETLDLLRRHADLLGQDLRQQGFGSVSFEFGPQGGRDGRGGGSDASAPLPDDTPAPDGPPSAPPSPSTVTLARVGVSGGLDLRL
jgi:hypothetical protein